MLVPQTGFGLRDGGLAVSGGVAEDGEEDRSGGHVGGVLGEPDYVDDCVELGSCLEGFDYVGWHFWGETDMIGRVRVRRRKFESSKYSDTGDIFFIIVFPLRLGQC